MVTFNDDPVTVKAGRRILVDGWEGHCTTELKTCEYPEMAPYRIPSGRYQNIAYPVRVEVVGRTLQSKPYQDCLWIRVKIVFVHDGEPETEHRGWMSV